MYAPHPSKSGHHHDPSVKVVKGRRWRQAQCLPTQYVVFDQFRKLHCGQYQSPCFFLSGNGPSNGGHWYPLWFISLLRLSVLAKKVFTLRVPARALPFLTDQDNTIRHAVCLSQNKKRMNSAATCKKPKYLHDSVSEFPPFKVRHRIISTTRIRFIPPLSFDTFRISSVARRRSSNA